MKVSIIIPVYNTEKYVSRCINSCLTQTLDDIEIILVDDCSTDNSIEIIKRYADKYQDKIHCIFQSENHRQGAARNRAMEIAKGEYIIFVDSDDWIDADMCHQLYNAAHKEDADMVGSDYFISFDDKDEIKKISIFPDMCGVMDYEKKDKYIKNYGMFWTRIYRREWLEKIKLKFPEDIFYEDAFFNFYSVLYADKIAHIREPFYHYYQGNVSTVRNRNNPHQYERIKLAEYILEWSKDKKELEQYKDIIEYKYLYMQGGNLLYTCLGQFDSPDKRKMGLINNDVRTNIKSVKKNENFLKLPEELRFFMRLNSISSRLCIFVYKYNIYNYLNAIKRKVKRLLC